MAYISKELKDTKAVKLKEIFKKYKVKATVAGGNSSAIKVNISAGALDFIGNFNKTTSDPMNILGYNHRPRDNEKVTNLSINPYHYKNHFTNNCLGFLQECMEILNEGNHDNSDIMTDYFDVGWYVDINIGKWNKPYQLIKE